MQELYSLSMEDFSHQAQLTPPERKRHFRWFYCGQEPFTVHKSMSEASMYRANSKFSLKSMFEGENKTLDYLMRCFWVCSTGCHQTT